MATDTVNIAADGDVNLVVGDDKKRLRVSSMMLSAVSPVFKALLGPHFREGAQPRSSTSPVEIALPDDSVDCIDWICRAIHHKGGDGPADSPELATLAVTIDKYDCINALRPHIVSSLLYLETMQSETKDVGAIWDMVAAAYMLDQPYCFKRLTHMLIVNTTDPYLSIVRARPISKRVPMDILVAIETKRSTARIMLGNELTNLAKCTACLGMDIQGFLTHAAKLLGSHIWPPDFSSSSSVDLREAMVRIEHMSDFKMTCCGANNGSVTYGWARQPKMANLARKVAAICEGLCLQCIVDDEPDLTTCTKHT